MKKFVFLITLLTAGSHLDAAIMYTATLHCDTGACLTGSVTTEVSWEVEPMVFSVEIDDNLGNFLFGLTGPLSPTNIGSIFPSPQTVSGLDVTVINLLTSTVGLTTQKSAMSTVTAGTPSFANLVLLTGTGSITELTRFTASIPFGSTQTPEPATWGFVAAGIGVMLIARARKRRTTRG